MKIGSSQQQIVGSQPPAMSRQDTSLLLVQIARDTFAISLIFLFILMVSEDLKFGFVSHHLDLRLILAACLVSGLANLLTSRFFAASKKDGNKRIG